VETLDLATFPFLMVVAYLAGLQYDKVRYLSDMDSLTGLYNRRFVVNSFPKIAALTDRSHSKLFVLVIDCDDFKDINDKYGHNNGDTVLEKIGVLLLSAMRKSDVVARWGGDEFLIIGHHKEEPGVNNMNQRLHNR
jgi:diguanylate cyclase (GGDEF)-like protein